MNYGQRMKEARKAAGLTQEQLAKECGVATITIRQYEACKREPRLKQFELIAKILGVDVNWLMHGKTLEQRDQEMKDYVKQRLEGLQARKMSDSEIQKAGFLQFHSDEDRIAYFYGQCLNIDGKLAASKYFFHCLIQHLDENLIKEAADYVQNLSEIPQFQPMKADEKEND